LQNSTLRCSQTGQGLAALSYSTAVAEETLRGLYPTITQHITRFPTQYLKFTHRFLICEMTSCCSCCIRDRYDTKSALCCRSVCPAESQGPDESFLLREAFSDNVIWGCTQQQLLLLDEHVENSPCASSAAGRFLSHTCYETYSRTEDLTRSWCQHQEARQVYYLVFQCSSLTELRTGSPAHPKQGRAISRQRYCETVLPVSRCSTPRCDAPSAKGMFCFAHI